MGLLDKLRGGGLTFPLPADFIPDEPRNDARTYGVLVKPSQAQPGEVYWQAVLVHHLTPDENRGRHHIFVEVLDEEGRRVNDVQVVITNGGTRTVKVNTSPKKPAVAFPMGKWDMYEISIANAPGDRVINVTSAHPAEGKGSPESHHSFLIVWRRTRLAREETEERAAEPHVEEGKPEPEAAPAVIAAPTPEGEEIPAATVEEPPTTAEEGPTAEEEPGAETPAEPSVEPTTEAPPPVEVPPPPEAVVPTTEPSPARTPVEEAPVGGEVETPPPPPEVPISAERGVEEEQETPPTLREEEALIEVEQPSEQVVQVAGERTEEEVVVAPVTVEDFQIAEAEAAGETVIEPQVPAPEPTPFYGESGAFDTYVLFAPASEATTRGLFYALVDDLVESGVPFGFGALEAATHFKRVFVVGTLDEESRKRLEEAHVEITYLEGDEDTVARELTEKLSVG